MLGKRQSPNRAAHGAEELLLQRRAPTELHEGDAKDIGEEQQEHQGEEPQGRDGDKIHDTQPPYGNVCTYSYKSIILPH